MKKVKIHRFFAVLMAFCLMLPQSIGMAMSPPKVNATANPPNSPSGSDLPLISNQPKDGGDGEGDLGDNPLERAEWFYSFRTAGNPNVDFTIQDAASLRAQAAQTVLSEKNQKPAGPSAGGYGGNWETLGPDPIVQVSRSDNSFIAVAGRVGALAIRSSPPYTMYLGAAQGGIWISSTLTGGWVSRTDQLPSLAIGAIALAPSNEDIVYVGTGEGALSGDSYFGNGVLKSTNGGSTFTQVSGSIFNQVSISKIVVDPTNADHLYVAVLSGVGGARRTRPPFPSPYGVWESTNGGVDWTQDLVTDDRLKGATDLVMDPLNPEDLYVSLWGQGISKSTDGGATWKTVMNGLPTNADYTVAPTRFALGISHPTAAISATLYTGFEWYDTNGNYHPSTVWRSTNEGQSWSETSTSVVGGYCGSSPSSTQCFYDNVIGVDPTNPDIVYALGLFNYNTGTGGVFRSMDGGATWLDLGWNQHPDYHAIAIRQDDPSHILVGNDGGVWYSTDYGGRLNPGDPVSDADWVNLNGTVDPNTGAVLKNTGLAITQFQSIGQNPSVTARTYGGNQDNGTLRKSTLSNTWYDMASGDGGQVLVDPTNPQYVYGTYYGISPYRFDDGMLGYFFSNEAIYNGLNRNDRSAFYIPFTMDPEFTNRLYLGTYRVYRTDNRGDLWQSISPDLTTGCTSSSASPTTYACVITALGVTAGAPAVYSGSGDGLVYMTTDATADLPDWVNVTKGPLPQRPVSWIAVDRSDYRVAYLAYGGFNAATPLQPGHVFKTTNAGQTWTDISGNLPDVPVNTLVLDPTHSDTLYAGTDVGPLVTTDGGSTWSPLGSDFPVVAVFQLDLNPYTGLLRAGTHGRAAWSLSNSTQEPALQIRAQDAGVPVGPGSVVTYTVTVKNVGDLAATGVTIKDTIPAHTTFMAAQDSGSLVGDHVEWDVSDVPTGTVVNSYGGVLPGSVSVSFTVQVDNDVQAGDVITNQDFSATSSEGANATGSPTPLTLAPENSLLLSPSDQLDGTRSGQPITYTLSIQNLGYMTDSYDLSVSGNNWPTTIWDSSFTNEITKTGSVAAGMMTDFGVKVMVPVTATNAAQDSAVVMAQSMENPSVSMTATVETKAVTVNVLMVDGDDNHPDVSSYYKAALDAAGYQYDTWDLAANSDLPLNYMKAHKAIVWFTGASYPNPITPYGDNLAAFLDNGGRLFMSGMDILDQSGGTTNFVHDYLHIDWNGTDAQNDIGTTTVTGVPTNTVTAGLGPYAMNYADVGLVDFSDEITPIDPAVPAFLDDANMPDALTVAADNYKVMFMAFPFEAMGTPADRALVMQKALTYFDVARNYKIYMPTIYANYLVP